MAGDTSGLITRLAGGLWGASADSEALEGVTDWPVIVLSDLGTRESRVCSINLRGISNVKGGRIHCLILPSSMDELEQSGFDGMYVGD